MNKLVGFLTGFVRGVLMGGAVLIVLIGVLQLIVVIVQADNTYIPLIEPYFDPPLYYDPHLETLIDIYDADQALSNEEYSYLTFEEKCASAVSDYKYHTDPLIPDFFKDHMAVLALFYYNRLKRCGFEIDIYGEWVRTRKSMIRTGG